MAFTHLTPNTNGLMSPGPTRDGHDFLAQGLQYALSGIGLKIRFSSPRVQSIHFLTEGSKYAFSHLGIKRCTSAPRAPGTRRTPILMQKTRSKSYQLVTFENRRSESSAGRPPSSQLVHSFWLTKRSLAKRRPLSLFDPINEISTPVN